MSNVYEKIKCKKCEEFVKFEVRQEIEFCSICAFYINRKGEYTRFNELKNSTTPWYSKQITTNNE